jgi:hypothetical protein
VPGLPGVTGLTVTVKEQVLVLPLPSVAVPVTVAVPTANVLPESGLVITAGLPQLSVAVTVNVTAAWQVLISAFTAIFDEQLITGTWLSITVTMNEQVLVLPLPSVAVLVTVWTPTVIVLPEAGLDTTVALPQLSLAVTVKFTVVVQSPASAFRLKPDGHVITGAWLSTTVTVKEQVAVLPLPSVAVLVTVVVPTLNTVPEFWLDTTAALPQLSLAVTEKVTVVEQRPASAFWLKLNGQLMAGAWESVTVTTKEHVEVFPLPSVAVPVTVVAPVLKVLPEAGLDIIVTLPQLSVAVTGKFTTAVQKPASAFWVKLKGQLMTGASASVTVTVKEQVLVLPLPSVAVPVTVVGPALNVLPEAGTEVTVTLLQLSLAVTVKFTAAVQCPASVFWLKFAGQLIAGAW